MANEDALKTPAGLLLDIADCGHALGPLASLSLAQPLVSISPSLSVSLFHISEGHDMGDASLSQSGSSTPKVLALSRCLSVSLSPTEV